MRIKFAHLREQSTGGGFIDFAVFDANASDGTDVGRDEVLTDLTIRARHMGLKVDVSALAYPEHGRVRFHGDRTVVEYLVRSGVPRWTHYMDL